LLIKGCGLPQYIGAKFVKAVPDVRFLCVPLGGGGFEFNGCCSCVHFYERSEIGLS